LRVLHEIFDRRLLVIGRVRRFPRRNALLGRRSGPSEEKFLGEAEFLIDLPLVKRPDDGSSTPKLSSPRTEATFNRSTSVAAAAGSVRAGPVHCGVRFPSSLVSDPTGYQWQELRGGATS